MIVSRYVKNLSFVLLVIFSVFKGQMSYSGDQEKEKRVMAIIKEQLDPERVFNQVQEILNKEALNINYQDPDSGDTFLLCTLKSPSYSFELACSLIEHGINVNARDNNKQKAFSIIVPWKDNIDIAHALIKANTTIGDSLRSQVKYYAKKYDNYAVDRLLTVAKSVALIINNYEEVDSKIDALKRMLKRQPSVMQHTLLCRLLTQGHVKVFYELVVNSELNHQVFSDKYALKQLIRLWQALNNSLYRDYTHYFLKKITTHVLSTLNKEQTEAHLLKILEEKLI